MTTIEQRERLLTLAKSLDVAGIGFGEPGNSYAGLDGLGRYRVLLDPTRNADETYFGCLHELGHIALAHPRNSRLSQESALASRGGPVMAGLLEAESDAWLWALDHAGCDVPEAALDYVVGAISSYRFDYHGPEPASYRALKERLS